MDRIKQTLITAGIFACVVCAFPCSGGASFERNPVKETQSNVVPVTEEMLNREGQLGPASPTFKIQDTAKFMVKKPINESAEPDDKIGKEEEKGSWWDQWFSWGDKKK